MFRKHQAHLLQIVQAANSWITRRQIAQALGVRRLNGSHHICLDLLVESGEIEVNKAERLGEIGFEYQYRAHHTGSHEDA
jgi:hypothetical protein